MSAYSDSEYNRLNNIKSAIKYEVIRQELDCRKKLYDEPEGTLHNIPCLVPIDCLVIRNDGSVGICCFDWKKTVVFGNIKDERIQDILVKPEYLEILDNLRYGKATTNVCKRCTIRTY